MLWLLMLAMTTQAQVEFTVPTTLFVMHSSGNHLKMASDYGGQLEAATASTSSRRVISPPP